MLKVRIVIEDISRDTIQEVYSIEKSLDINPEDSVKLQEVFTEIINRSKEFC